MRSEEPKRSEGDHYLMLRLKKESEQKLLADSRMSMKNYLIQKLR